MTRPLTVGVQLPEVEYEISFADLLDLARTAEAVGFDAVWVGDHLIYDLPIGPRGPWEAWTSLAAIAAVTERIKLGPLVASLGFHEPAMLAKQAATVDAISNGRLILAVGAGWNEREYRAFGYPFDHRVSRFEEAFTIIRSLLREGEINFNGRYYNVENCVLHPRPIQPNGPQLWVGTNRPRMLSITAPHIDAWNIWWSEFGNTVDGFVREKLKADTAIRAAGRDPSEVDATCALLIEMPTGTGRALGHDDKEGVHPIRGSAKEIADQLRAFAAVGVCAVQLVLDPITRDSIEFFADVLAELDA
jgi:probable F420-dependent oxidoreductase